MTGIFCKQVFSLGLGLETLSLDISRSSRVSTTSLNTTHSYEMSSVLRCVALHATL